MNSEKQYQLEFLVEADTWQEVVEIFKTDLGIDNNKQHISRTCEYERFGYK